LHVPNTVQPSGFFPSNYVSRLDQLSLNDSQDQCNYQDDEYFEGYANLSIHLEMLQDKSRTLAYKDAVDLSAQFMRDKIVLDIGCGSGILSIFCAKAGARHVYAIDASAVIDHATIVVNENGLDDKITLIKGLKKHESTVMAAKFNRISNQCCVCDSEYLGKIEDIVLPVDKVDIIISEWMGTLLICESMIASVLWAREKYLQPNGLMIPEVHRVVIVCSY
jgi:predicted RNA methylase